MTTGIIEKVTQLLEASAIDSVIYDGVQPNPTVENVDEDIAIYKKEKYNEMKKLTDQTALEKGSVVNWR